MKSIKQSIRKQTHSYEITSIFYYISTFQRNSIGSKYKYFQTFAFFPFFYLITNKIKTNVDYTINKKDQDKQNVYFIRNEKDSQMNSLMIVQLNYN
jgi:hypothetical protein